MSRIILQIIAALGRAFVGAIACAISLALATRTATDYFGLRLFENTALGDHSFFNLIKFGGMAGAVLAALYGGSVIPGRVGSAIKGMAWGAVAGVLAGAGLGAVIGSMSGNPRGGPAGVALGIFLGTPLVALIGGAIGGAPATGKPATGKPEKGPVLDLDE